MLIMFTVDSRFRLFAINTYRCQKISCSYHNKKLTRRDAGPARGLMAGFAGPLDSGFWSVRVGRCVRCRLPRAGLAAAACQARSERREVIQVSRAAGDECSR